VRPVVQQKRLEKVTGLLRSVLGDVAVGVVELVLGVRVNEDVVALHRLRGVSYFFPRSSRASRTIESLLRRTTACQRNGAGNRV